MPFQSEKQRRYMHANLPDIANRWEAKYGLGGIAELNSQLNQLPEYYLPKNQGGRIGFDSGTNYKTLPYDFLGSNNIANYSNRLKSAGEIVDSYRELPTDRLKRAEATKLNRENNYFKVKAMGDASLTTKLEAYKPDGSGLSDTTKTLGGVTKIGINGYHGDKVSILPYGDAETTYSGIAREEGPTILDLNEEDIADGGARRNGQK